MKRTVLLSVVLLLGAAFALTGAQTDLVATATPFGGTSAGSVSASAGNIYTVNLTAEQQTYRWVGFLGNLTGKIVLRDNAGNDFYTWTAAAEGSVIMARASSTTPALGSIAAGDAATADTDYGYDTAVSDSVSNTYTATASISFPSGYSVASAPATTVGTWTNVLLADGQDTGTIGAHLWAVTATAPAAGYDGSLVNYELLVPEDGEAGDTTPTTYYFWVDLK